MQFVEVWVNPKYTIREYRLNEHPRDETENFIYKVLGPDLPGLFVDNGEKFGMTPGTSQDDVSVEFFDLGENGINVPQMWIKAYFDRVAPPVANRLSVTKAVYLALIEAFNALGINEPTSFKVTVFWGPSDSRGTLNGSPIER